MPTCPKPACGAICDKGWVENPMSSSTICICLVHLSSSKVFSPSTTPCTLQSRCTECPYIVTYDLCCRDVANGFLVAEILSCYFPQDIKMHGFANATSSHYKRDNWNQVIRFCAKQAIPLPIDLVEQTLVGAHGAGEALLEHLYETFTGKKLQRISEPEVLEASQAMPALAPQPIPVKGPGDGGDQAGKMQSIRGNIPAGTSIEFGKVKTQPVPGDALKLRSQLSSNG
ncbi:hypothetical protein DUNSADRAFT_13324 [Dunaliella salina]|uniref:CH-like domain-containing protein n=1 Tax=Dunaliella salina TaxID=3046 RepID=A0ABQ7G9Q3_DUNSA|nr:hypothetical protein DUNSADRAFT_13324 [Dunaliella salina]|eukprot:KAF5831295.1 hypothetical protein DUNSADRAFT_13324 [Dunaliella salina]